MKKIRKSNYAFFALHLQLGPQVHTPVDLQLQLESIQPWGLQPHPAIQISSNHYLLITITEIIITDSIHDIVFLNTIYSTNRSIKKSISK